MIRTARGGRRGPLRRRHSEGHRHDRSRRAEPRGRGCMEKLRWLLSTPRSVRARAPSAIETNHGVSHPHGLFVVLGAWSFVRYHFEQARPSFPPQQPAPETSSPDITSSRPGHAYPRRVAKCEAAVYWCSFSFSVRFSLPACVWWLESSFPVGRRRCLLRIPAVAASFGPKPTANAVDPPVLAAARASFLITASADRSHREGQQKYQ